MPKETIHGHTPNGLQIGVGWDREAGAVQVSTSAYDARHLMDHLYADDQTTIGRLTWEKLHALVPEAFAPLDFRSPTEEAALYNRVGREVLDAVTGASPHGSDVKWYPNRTQINDLIRLLRKARDAAMGRDE